MNNEEEEGQAESAIDEGLTGSISPILDKGRMQSNLSKVTETVKDYIARFLSQPLQVDKSNA